MIHIKEIQEKILNNASKAKFYHHNRDIFIKYFDSIEQYNSLIMSGKFDKLEQIINENTNFTMSIVENVINNLNKKYESIKN